MQKALNNLTSIGNSKSTGATAPTMSPATDSEGPASTQEQQAVSRSNSSNIIGKGSQKPTGSKRNQPPKTQETTMGSVGNGTTGNGDAKPPVPAPSTGRSWATLVKGPISSSSSQANGQAESSTNKSAATAAAGQSQQASGSKQVAPSQPNDAKSGQLKFGDIEVSTVAKDNNNAKSTTTGKSAAPLPPQSVDSAASSATNAGPTTRPPAPKPTSFAAAAAAGTPAANKPSPSSPSPAAAPAASTVAVTSAAAPPPPPAGERAPAVAPTQPPPPPRQQHHQQQQQQHYVGGQQNRHHHQQQQQQQHQRGGGNFNNHHHQQQQQHHHLHQQQHGMPPPPLPGQMYPGVYPPPPPGAGGPGGVNPYTMMNPNTLPFQPYTHMPYGHHMPGGGPPPPPPGAAGAGAYYPGGPGGFGGPQAYLQFSSPPPQHQQQQQQQQAGMMMHHHHHHHPGGPPPPPPPGQQQQQQQGGPMGYGGGPGGAGSPQIRASMAPGGGPNGGKKQGVPVPPPPPPPPSAASSQGGGATVAVNGTPTAAAGGGGGSAGGAARPAPVAPIVPRERKVLRIENPDTHEVLDLSSMPGQKKKDEEDKKRKEAQEQEEEKKKKEAAAVKPADSSKPAATKEAAAAAAVAPEKSATKAAAAGAAAGAAAWGASSKSFKDIVSTDGAAAKKVAAEAEAAGAAGKAKQAAPPTTTITSSNEVAQQKVEAVVPPSKPQPAVVAPKAAEAAPAVVPPSAAAPTPPPRPPPPPPAAAVEAVKVTPPPPPPAAPAADLEDKTSPPPPPAATQAAEPEPEQQEEPAKPAVEEPKDQPVLVNGRKRYFMEFLKSFQPHCKDALEDIEAETFDALARGQDEDPNYFPGDEYPTNQRVGGGGGYHREHRDDHRGGPGGGDGQAVGGGDRWQKTGGGRGGGGPPGGPPGMMGGRGGGGRGGGGGGRRGPPGSESDTWEKGRPLPPMAGGVQGLSGREGDRRLPPGMRINSGNLPILHRTESAYKVGGTTTSDPEEEKAQKALKSMLNKITPQNENRITGQIVEKIKERGKAITLQGFIDQIFDKALIEFNFAELYARLVAKLNPALPELADDQGHPVQFRRTLLNKCQEEFEAGVKAMDAVGERERRAKAAGKDGEEEEKVDEEEEEKAAEKENDDAAAAAAEDGGGKEEVDKEDGEIADPVADKKKREAAEAEAEFKARKRMLGNIQFVGQLYRMGVLTQGIMHSCIQQLLTQTNSPRPEDVECLCQLLSTVGLPIDSSDQNFKRTDEQGNIVSVPAREAMDVYFKRIDALRHNPALDSRHQFMLVDLMELRERRWQEREGTNKAKPKTIDEIHREAEAELREKAKSSYQMDRHGSSRDFNRRGSGSLGPSGNSSSSRAPFDRVDGPIRPMARGGSQDALGAGGSFRPGGRPAPPPRDARGAPRPAEPQQTSSSTESSTTRDSTLTAAVAPPPPPPQQPRPTATNRPASPSSTDNETKKDVNFEGRVKGLLAEVFNDPTVMDDSLLTLKELKSAHVSMPEAVELMFNHTLEGKGTNWEVFSKLLVTASAEGEEEGAILDKEAVESGIRALLNNLDDLQVDVPKAPVQVGDVLGALVASKTLELAALGKHIQEAENEEFADEREPDEPTMLIDGGAAAKLVGAMLKRLSADAGVEAAAEMWKESGLSFESFMSPIDREDGGRKSKLVEEFGLAAVLQ